jgi:transcriptional regulator with XRE-family HTH domain
MDLRRQLAEVLRRMRHEAGLTQRDAARQLGISQPALARLENCDLNTTLDTLTRLCRSLHCVGELFSRKGALATRALDQFARRTTSRQRLTVEHEASVTAGDGTATRRVMNVVRTLG